MTENHFFLNAKKLKTKIQQTNTQKSFKFMYKRDIFIFSEQMASMAGQYPVHIHVLSQLS